MVIEQTANTMRANDVEPCEEFEDEWIQTLTTAMLQDNTFRKVMGEESQTPDTFNMPKAAFDPEWLASIYLRGFYDCFEDDDEATSHLKDLGRQAQEVATAKTVSIFDKQEYISSNNMGVFLHIDDAM